MAGSDDALNVSQGNKLTKFRLAQPYLSMASTAVFSAVSYPKV